MPIVNVMLRESKAVRNLIKADVLKPGNRANDVKIEDVRELRRLGKENTALVFEFLFTAKYDLKEPKDHSLGEISVKGEILYVNTKDEMKNIMDVWKKDKKLEPKIMGSILNAALAKSQVEAIEQAAKVGLPSPVPLPMLKASKPSSKSSAA